MPELPEVETIRRQLAPEVSGARVVEAWAHPSHKFVAATEAVGSTIGELRRRGKYLLFDLRGETERETEDGSAGERELIVHLGMTGSLHIRNRDRAGAEHDDGRLADPDHHTHVRARWLFADGRSLVFDDTRRFGRIAVVVRGDHADLPTLAQLGPEPLSDDFSPETLWEGLRASSRPVKTKLLSQRPVAGVGNIYADEALWQARIHPRARALSLERATRLWESVREVLASSVDHGGTTLRDYVDAEGAAGRNQSRLQCYGQAGRPCARCGATLRGITLDGRSTTYCPACQRV